MGSRREYGNWVVVGVKEHPKRNRVRSGKLSLEVEEL